MDKLCASAVPEHQRKNEKLTGGTHRRKLPDEPRRRWILSFLKMSICFAVNKPPGWNTHSPRALSPARVFMNGCGIESRAGRPVHPSIVLTRKHPGLILFGKTTVANPVSCPANLKHKASRKSMPLIDRSVNPAFQELAATLALVRVGEKYVARPAHAGALLSPKLSSVQQGK